MFFIVISNHRDLFPTRITLKVVSALGDNQDIPRYVSYIRYDPVECGGVAGGLTVPTEQWDIKDRADLGDYNVL